MEYNGYDLSIYQKGINYNKLAESGKFAILKIGESDFKDKMFETHYAECKKRNMWIGGYYFSRATTVSEAEEEARRCLEYIEGKEFEMPIYYDVETNAHTKLDKNLLTKIVMKFCEIICKSNRNLKYGIYTNPNFMENFLIKEDFIRRDDIHIWLAHWTNNPDKKSKYYYGQEVWQWGITKVGGMDVDANISFVNFSNNDNSKPVYLVSAVKTFDNKEEAIKSAQDLSKDKYYINIQSSDWEI